MKKLTWKAIIKGKGEEIMNREIHKINYYHAEIEIPGGHMQMRVNM